MAISDVVIVNRAIRKLGGNPITSMDPSVDASEEARIINEIFEVTRDEILRAHPWNFAMKRIDLPADVAVPAWGFKYQYTLPTDCLRVYEIQNDPPYKVEGGKILTNYSTTPSPAGQLFLLYIARIKDANLYDMGFVDTLASKLAVDMVEALTQSSSKKAALLAEFEETFAQARNADAKEDGSIIRKEDDWINIRL